VRFALLHEDPASDGAETPAAHERFAQFLEQVGIAEQAGFHSVWSVESPGAEPSATATAPEIWLSAVAAHTRTLRIGQGVRLHPYGYHNPIRTAEMAAVLDILSSGRLDFGSTADQTDDDSRPWDEALRMIPRMWTESDFSWDSPSFQMPPCDVHPKPVQDPHPPLWLSGEGEDDAVRAGERGIGFIHFEDAGAPEERAVCVAAYRAAISRATPIGGFVNEQFASVTRLVCVAPEAKEQERGGAANAGRTIEGDSQHCIREIEVAASDGVDLLFVRSARVGLDHRAACDSLRRIGREVIPHFAG
jgi:alkanesulfonate monooxygenase SsuD/methylene tetrahydromethanopterin reductase-like flavin-dependent oxidoreductase (luciferase family)